jgi:hypothetical protein
MADVNGSTCAIGSHWDIPSHQHRTLASNRPARQDWMSCSAVKGPVGCFPSPGMYQAEPEAFTIQYLLSVLGDKLTASEPKMNQGTVGKGTLSLAHYV